MKKNKKTWKVLTTFTLASLVFAGCGSAPTSSTTNTPGSTSQDNGNATTTKTVDFSNASGTIVWASGPITRTGMRKGMIAEFEKTHPNIKVTLQDQSNNTDTNRSSLTTQIGGGSDIPDVYSGDVVWGAQFAQAQLAAPLDQYFGKDWFNRFAKGLTDGETYKGNVYAAPFFTDTSYLYYRKDLLTQAGLSVPKTWAEVEKDAKILKDKGLVKEGFVWQGASYEGLTCNFMEYLADAGGKVFDDKGKVVINSPEAKKALTEMKNLVDTGISPKAVSTFKEADSINVFDAGDAAFVRYWSAGWKNTQTPANSKVVDKVGVALLPTFDGQNTAYSTQGGWNLMLNPHTKNLKAALAFMDWMTGPEGQAVVAKQWSMLPTNASVQADPEVQKINPVLSLLSQVRETNRPSTVANYPGISKAIYQNVNEVLSGGETVDAALADMQKQIETTTSGNGGL